MTRTYGLIRQPDDPRDYGFERFVTINNLTLAPLPPKTNNYPSCARPSDQLTLGSCTAEAGKGLVEDRASKNGLPYVALSAMFLYWNERLIENASPNRDTGATLRVCMKALSTYGICSEADWSYDLGHWKSKPIPQAYVDAIANVITSYYALHTITDLKTCLANGHRFVGGFSVYPYFETRQMANTGVLTLPKRGEKPLGGHAVEYVDYDDSLKAFLCKNSWGMNWGLPDKRGFFLMPYAYVTNPLLAFDFWTA